MSVSTSSSQPCAPNYAPSGDASPPVETLLRSFRLAFRAENLMDKTLVAIAGGSAGSALTRVGSEQMRGSARRSLLFVAKRPTDKGHGHVDYKRGPLAYATIASHEGDPP